MSPSQCTCLTCEAQLMHSGMNTHVLYSGSSRAVAHGLPSLRVPSMNLREIKLRVGTGFVKRTATQHTHTPEQG